MADEIAPKGRSQTVAPQRLGAQSGSQERAEPESSRTIDSQKTNSQKITSQKITWQKISWKKAGHVVEPGRYMYRFGWLTVTAEDIAVWRQYPQAEFTMLQLPRPSGASSAKDAVDDLDEYHLGTFELPRA